MWQLRLAICVLAGVWLRASVHTQEEERVGVATVWVMTYILMVLMAFICGQVSVMILYILYVWVFVVFKPLFLLCVGHVSRQVASPSQHILAADDVVSCCLDLSVPSISFRINGHPVQGMFENFNLDGLFFPVISYSAGVK